MIADGSVALALEGSATDPVCTVHALDENEHIDKYIQGIKYAAATMDRFGKS